jgi:hypothetical protein
VPTDGSTLPPARMSDYVAAADPYASPGFLAVMPQDTLLDATPHPATQMYLYHEQNDDLVPVEVADRLAAQWCAQGVPLAFYHSTAATVPGSVGVPTVDVHLAGAVVGAPTAFAWIDGQFAALPVAVTPPGTERCN